MSEMKKTRRKLKDRLIESSPLLDTVLESAAILSSRRRKISRAQKSTASSSSGHTHDVSLPGGETISSVQMKKIKHADTREKNIVDSSLTLQGAAFSTSPETIEKIRVHVGLSPKSHHLVDLQVRHPSILREPPQPPRVTPAPDFLTAPIDEQKKEVEKPFIRRVDMTTSSPQPMVISTASFSWKKSQTWFEAVRFGTIALSCAILALGFLGWRSLWNEAQVFIASASEALQKTDASFSSDNALEAVKKK